MPLVLAALYWRRVTRAGALASVLVMAVVWFALFYQRDARARSRAASASRASYQVWGVTPVAFVIAASALALWLVSLVTAPPPREHVARFFIEPA